MDDAQAQRWKKLRTVDIQEELEKMFGAGTQLCGLQKPELEAIMKHGSLMVTGYCHHAAGVLQERMVVSRLGFRVQSGTVGACETWGHRSPS